MLLIFSDDRPYLRSFYDHLKKITVVFPQFRWMGSRAVMYKFAHVEGGKERKGGGLLPLIYAPEKMP